MSVKREREVVQIDAEHEIPQAKRQKKNSVEPEVKNQVLEELKLREIVNLFNRKSNQGTVHIDKYICYECKDLCLGESNVFFIGTEEEDYCDNCVKVCEGCGDTYCEELAYKHEDCIEEEEEEEIGRIDREGKRV